MRNLMVLLSLLAGSVAGADDESAAQRGRWDFRITSAAVVTHCINQFAETVSKDETRLRMKLQTQCGKQALELVDGKKLAGFLTAKGEAVVHKVESTQAE